MRSLFPIFLPLLIAVGSASAATVTLDSTTTGFYHESGIRLFTGGYSAGWCSACQPTGEGRSYLVFDLSGVSSPILSASLRLPVPNIGYLSNDPFETYTLFDISTPISSIIAGNAGLSGYTDLGSGIAYGSLDITGLEQNHVDVILNANGLTYLNSTLGQVAAFGAADTTLAKVTEQEFLFNNSRDLIPQLILTTSDQPQGSDTPEPGTLALFGMGFVALAMLRRR